MTGRKILDESDPILVKYHHPDLVQRRLILKETLNAFSKTSLSNQYHLLADKNLRKWQKKEKSINVNNKIQVFSGDWGEITLMLTKKYGTCFAVLNMANAYIPGGGYVEGMAAQEENMFRRTDCHFKITSEEYNESTDRYTPEMTELLSAKYEVVYLDKEHPRVCIRGSENRYMDNLGYEWLADDEIFPFYELRASAQDLRGEISFNASEARKKIVAQLDTLRITGIRYAVLGAFGCGAFQNPPDVVAQIYKQEIDKRIDDFDLIAFAIFSSGGTDNYEPFKKVFGQDSKGDVISYQ